MLCNFLRYRNCFRINSVIIFCPMVLLVLRTEIFRRTQWRSLRRKSRRAPELGANFPEALVLPENFKPKVLSRNSLSCSRKSQKEFTNLELLRSRKIDLVLFKWGFEKGYLKAKTAHFWGKCVSKKTYNPEEKSCLQNPRFRKQKGPC